MTTAQIIGYSLTYLGLLGFIMMCWQISKPEMKEESHLEIDVFGALREIEETV